MWLKQAVALSPTLLGTLDHSLPLGTPSHSGFSTQTLLRPIFQTPSFRKHRWLCSTYACDVTAWDHFPSYLSHGSEQSWLLAWILREVPLLLPSVSCQHGGRDDPVRTRAGHHANPGSQSLSSPVLTGLEGPTEPGPLTAGTPSHVRPTPMLHQSCRPVRRPPGLHTAVARLSLPGTLLGSPPPS